MLHVPQFLLFHNSESYPHHMSRNQRLSSYLLSSYMRFQLSTLSSKNKKDKLHSFLFIHLVNLEGRSEVPVI